LQGRTLSIRKGSEGSRLTVEKKQDKVSNYDKGAKDLNDAGRRNPTENGKGEKWEKKREPFFCRKWDLEILQKGGRSEAHLPHG